MLADGAREERQVGRPTAGVDVRSVGCDSDRDHLRAKPAEDVGRELRIGAIRAVQADSATREVAAEPADDVLGVALCGRSVARDGALLRTPSGLLEQGLDLELRRVAQLVPVAVEDLDPVVLGRVVRRRDDDAEVEREQRDRRGRQHPGEHRVAPGGDHAAREGVLELRPRAARVAADEDAPAACPARRRAAEPRDQVGRQRLADDPADAVRAEVAPTHGRGSLGHPRATAVHLWRTVWTTCFTLVALRGTVPGTDPARTCPGWTPSGRALARRQAASGDVTASACDATGRVSASRTAAPCAPCAGRPSCARPCGRRGRGTLRA